MSRPTRVMVLGAGGQLGRALVRTLGASGRWDTVPRDLDQLDITDARALRTFVREQQPAWVINCAALTNVDYCETHPDETDAVNAQPVATLADACNELDGGLVQISTDFVFDGTLDRPYREDDPPNPLNIYGRSKLRSEELALQCRRAVVVRTAWLYGLGEGNFVAKILARAATGSPLRVVNDQIGSPTYAPDLSECIERLMHGGAQGVFHAVNDGRASWYELACQAVEGAGYDTPISPISSTEYESPATRPANAVLDCDKYAKLTGHRPRTWTAALEAHLQR